MDWTKSLIKMPEGIKTEDYIIATYYLETPMELYKAADALAAEQSTGTWIRVGFETDTMRKKHAARVIGVFQVPYHPAVPSLPTGMEMKSIFEGEKEGRINAGVIQIAFPHINFGPYIPNLLTCVAGNLYEMGAFTAIRLLDLHFPKSYTKDFTGPKFGIKGTRKILGVYDRPLLGAIVKPCVGLTTDQLAELAYQSAAGGIDFLKDDELLADPSYNRLEERVKKVVKALKKAESEKGEKTMYAFNITSRVDKIRELYDIVIENGGNCVMINVATAGYSAMRVLAEYTEVPIHCHRDFAPAYFRSEYIGMSAKVFTKICRLSGADQMHCGAIQGKLFESDDEFLLSADTCTQDFYNIGECLPVSSGGQWAGKAPVNHTKIGHLDFLHLSGGGVFAHPKGAKSGARSVRQAHDAVLKGISLEEYAKDHKELKEAMDYFGKR